MKYLFSLLLIPILSFSVCEKPPTSKCIESKISAMQKANQDHTSVTRYKVKGKYYWVFDNGSAFDAPRYVLNVACDTVCMGPTRGNRKPCPMALDFDNPTAVVLWKSKVTPQ